MIIRITEDTTRIGFRLRDWKNSRILTDWEHIMLVIAPGQLDQPCWVPGGSPLYLYGYWPGKPTGVDIANPPPPDFPSLAMPAFEMGDNCTVIFLLHKYFYELPHGRYTGILQYHPRGVERVVNENIKPTEKSVTPFDWIPPKYWDGAVPCSEPAPPIPKPVPPRPSFCVLGTFDIDYGQRCDEHIIDLVTVEYALNHCEDC